jgi:hypothetical protein
LREYRDGHPLIVTLWSADEYPALTAAVEHHIPAAVRSAARPADLVRSGRDAAWALARTGDTILVYITSGQPVTVDLADEPGSFAVSWVSDAGTAPATGATVQGGRAVTLAPPAAIAGRPVVAWLTRAAYDPT